MTCVAMVDTLLTGAILWINSRIIAIRIPGGTEVKSYSLK